MASRTVPAEQLDDPQPRIDWLCRHANGPEVLDVACGNGAICILLGRDGIRATGVDATSDHIDRARTALDAEDPPVRERVRLEHVQSTALPFEDGRFHTVVLDDRLAHLLEPAKTIEEMRRVLRDDGTALLSVRIGVVRHDGHVDEMGAHRIAAALAPSFVPERLELLGPYLMVAARPGSAEPEQLAARLLEVTDARLRALEHAHLAALDELARTRRELDHTSQTLEAETARADRLKRTFERQRQHWSWQMAVALREALRSPRDFLALPIRLLRIVARRLRRKP